jgi:hypothetical protein
MELSGAEARSERGTDSVHLDLRLAVVGFDGAARKRLVDWSAPLRHGEKLRIVEPGEADALWIDGKCVLQATARELVLAVAGHPSPVRIPLHAQSRPVAIGLPCAHRVPHALTFDAESQYGVVSMARALGRRLMPAKLEFALGQLIAKARIEPGRRGVYHLVHLQRMVAVIDYPARTCAYLPSAVPAMLHGATWHKRPDTAGDAPPGFAVRTLDDLVWTYASRTREVLLDDDHWECRFSLRRMPHVPRELLQDGHVSVMSLVHRAPATVEELAGHLRTEAERVARWVAALHFVGALEAESMPARGAFDLLRKALPRAGRTLRAARSALRAPTLQPRGGFLVGSAC